MDKNAFLYAVNPRRPIKNLNSEIPIIRTNKSLYLTKEEVEKCLPFASIYRRFSVDQLVKVTSSNLERLHNSKFYTESDWDNFKEDKLGENRGKVEKPKNNESNTTQVQGELKTAAETDITIPEETTKNEALTENEEVESTTESNNIGLDVNSTDENAYDAVESLPQHELETENTVVDDTGIIDNADSSKVVINENEYYGKKKKHKH